MGRCPLHRHRLTGDRNWLVDLYAPLPGYAGFANRPNGRMILYARCLMALFSVLENKYWIDELYWTVILNPYIAISKFLADVIDWRFWHDWFHDQVIARGFTRFDPVAFYSNRSGFDRLGSPMVWQPLPNSLLGSYAGCKPVMCAIMLCLFSWVSSSSWAT